MANAAAYDLPLPTEVYSSFRWEDAALSDTVDMKPGMRGIYVGVGGDIKIMGRDGVSCLFKNAASGSIISVMAARIWSTGTTATNLIALY